MSSLIAPSLPAGLGVPDELEQAWQWMEEQGWALEDQHGWFLTPCPGDRVLGPEFCALDGLVEDWFGPDAPVDRLVPIALVAGSGSAAALWLDDSGTVRFVGLGADGAAWLLADSALDFLRLVAVGHRELTPYELGLPPDEESVAALAPFRAWVEERFDVTVPAEWPAVGHDEFSAWADRVRGLPVPGPDEGPRPDDSPGAAAVTGSVRDFLRLLGETADRAALDRLAGLTGTPVDADVTDVRWARPALRSVGVEVSVKHGRIETIWVSLRGDRATYPRAEELLPGVTSLRTADDVVDLLGEPERHKPLGVRYVVDGRYLHLGIGESGVELVTLMCDAP